GLSVPPVMALFFSGDSEAAKSIFKRWLDRFGKDDRPGEIYVAVIRDVCADFPGHYSILITSKQTPSEELRRGGAMVLTRSLRMQPDTDENLHRFLIEYENFGAYLLMPAVSNCGRPTP